MPTVEEDEGHSEWISIQTIAISPNNKIFVAGSWDNTIATWGSSIGWLVRMWKGHDRSVLSVVFSPDCRFFASAAGEMVVKF
jgi:WD40 repeat protein